MPGTKAGGKAAAITNKARYGADHYRRIGSKGGKNGRGYGFAHGKVDPVEAGRKGGYSGKPYIHKSTSSRKYATLEGKRAMTPLFKLHAFIARLLLPKELR